MNTPSPIGFRPLVWLASFFMVGTICGLQFNAAHWWVVGGFVFTILLWMGAVLCGPRGTTLSSLAVYAAFFMCGWSAAALRSDAIASSLSNTVTAVEHHERVVVEGRVSGETQCWPNGAFSPVVPSILIWARIDDSGRRLKKTLRSPTLRKKRTMASWSSITCERKGMGPFVDYRSANTLSIHPLHL